MAATPVDVVGSTPIAFTNKEGAQKFVPLSALQLTGSRIGVKSNPVDWASLFDANETSRLLAVAQAKVAAGELTTPPSPPPAPALAFTATHTGPETNGITVTVSTTPGTGGPLTTQIAVTATETDTWSGLTDGNAAAQAVGVDKPTGKAGDPSAATGLIAVVQGSVVTAGVGIPVVVPSTTLQAGKPPVDIVDKSKNKVFSIKPRADYAGNGGLSFSVTPDPSGSTFRITAAYDSSKEKGGKGSITLQTLSGLPAPVAYLVTPSAPPTGALVPADNGSVNLSGGAPGIAAIGLLYT